MNSDRLQRLRAMIEQVDPSQRSAGLQESLESSSGNALGEPTLDVQRPGPIASAEAEIALESLDVLSRGDEVDAEHQFALEAIVMPFHRPVVDVVDNHMSLSQLSSKWAHLAKDDRRPQIERTFLSIGRLEIPGHPSLPYAGTGFVVGKLSDDRFLLMTNRHVAAIFASGLGSRDLQFVPGQLVNIDFLQENGRNASESLQVKRVVMVHPYWDMALLEVSGLPANRKPLSLRTDDPTALAGSEVVVVGYPGYDPTGDSIFQQTQSRIFRGVYFVKRMQPGVLRERADVQSFDSIVPAITHDCSTLGGNSGSAVIDVATGDVLGLHFAGAYLLANYAVPTHDLAEDSRVVDSGVNFIGQIAPRNEFYRNAWSAADQESPGDGSAKVSSPGSLVQSPNPVHTPDPTAAASVDAAQATSLTRPAQSQTVTMTLPLQVRVTVSLGDAESTTALMTPHRVPAEEGLFGRQLSLTDAAAKFSLESLDKAGFDWKASLSLAVASKLAYSDAVTVVSIATGAMGFASCRFLEADDTQCFVAEDDDIVLVSFRGTESLRDWLSDLNALSTTRSYGDLHRGFFNAFRAVNEQLLAELRTIGDRRLVLTGHSLGGALASVAAAEWKTKFSVRSIYTYGQPAIGKGGFRSYFQSLFGSLMFRFVNDDDIVPRVPPTFQHVGQQKRLDSRGGLSANTESFMAEPPMMSQAQFDAMRAQLLQQRAREAQGSVNESLGMPMTEGLFPSFMDHKIDNYIAKIEKNV